jgi:hypothetical protein
MRAHRLLVAVVVALACVVHVTCSPFSAAEAPKSDDGGTTEAGTSSEGGGTGDGGGGDGGCAHKFCASFDGLTPSSEWPTNVEGLGAMTLTLDTQSFVSPPSSLHIVAGPNSDQRNSYVEKKFAAAQRYQFSAMVKLNTFGGPDGEVDLVDLELDPPPEGFSRLFFGLIAVPNGELLIERQDLSDVRVPLDKFATDFVRVTFDIDLTNGRFVVTVGGETVVDAPTVKTQSKGITLSVGLPFTSNTKGSYEANIDDVTFD